MNLIFKDVCAAHERHILVLFPAFLLDVNHKMYVGRLSVHPPGTAGHAPKVHCSREGFSL